MVARELPLNYSLPFSSTKGQVMLCNMVEGNTGIFSSKLTDEFEERFGKV